MVDVIFSVDHTRLSSDGHTEDNNIIVMGNVNQTTVFVNWYLHTCTRR